MAALRQNIPDNAVKLLFAEDLVNHVMLSYDISFDSIKESKRFRDIVYNAFNETVRDAVDFLTSQFNMGNSLKFEILEAAGMKSEGAFLKIAEHLRERFFSEGFEARKFLYYCSHLSSLAGIFYSFGIQEAPHIAADAIAKSLSGYPTHTGAWDTVNNIAMDLSNMALTCEYNEFPVDSLVRDHYRNQPPQMDSPREESSDDEPISDFEKGVLNYISLDEFLGIDTEWKNTLLPLLAEKESSPSEESSEGSQQSD